ncbi:MAG: cytochrome b/b6 domain-containing protein, partial [Natronospirillum sp.]
GLLLFRVIWGFVGTTYARFSGFGLSLTGLLKQLSAMARGDAPPYLGHNPAGAIMVVVLLAVLLAQVTTGLFYTDDIFWFGPLYDVGPDWVLAVSASVHPQLPKVIMLLVATHIAAVLYHSIRLREPLVAAMFHGRKPSTDPLLRRSEISTLWLVLTVLVTGLWLVWLLSRPI